MDVKFQPAKPTGETLELLAELLEETSKLMLAELEINIRKQLKLLAASSKKGESVDE